MEIGPRLVAKRRTSPLRTNCGGSSLPSGWHGLWWCWSLEALFHEEGDEVLDAVGVAPLVVVPADDLAGVADDLGQLGVDDGGEWVALEVGADEFFVGVAEVGLQGAVGGCFEGGVDALDVDGLLG